MDNDQIIDEITRIRAKNNIGWMKLLRLALKAEPKKAKTILNSIMINDQYITKLTRKLK